MTLMQYAERGRKPVRYLESARTQLAMFVAATPDDDLKGFEASLHDLLQAGKVMRPLLTAWTGGNLSVIAKINSESAEKDPRGRQLILDLRNHNWIPQIEKMLIDKQTTFITVGAAHLAGSGSVIDLMCQRGWKVERLKTGPTTPPAACATMPKPKSINSNNNIALRL